MCLFLCFAPLAPAGAQVSREYQLKAVFLWRLAQFTQWPASAFETPESPVVLCVLGDNPFGGALEAAVRGETAHSRSLVVRYHRAVDQARMCHILYFGAPAARQLSEIVAAAPERSILTVSDIKGFARFHNGMVEFVTEENKIRMRINPNAAAAAGLALDPRLLRAAEIVGK